VAFPLDRYYLLEEQCTFLLASFFWSAFNTFYPCHQHYLHHQLKESMGNFEVSVALLKAFSFVSNWV
jgi:hypothetical protein